MIFEFVSYNSLVKGHTMTAAHIVDPAGLLGELLAEASLGLMRHLLQAVINELPSTDADAVAGAWQPVIHAISVAPQAWSI